MPENKSIVTGGVLRAVHYAISAICFFFIFLLAVTIAPDRMDQELILTLIIAVLLLTFMLYNSRVLDSISKRVDEIAKHIKPEG